MTAASLEAAASGSRWALDRAAAEQRQANRRRSMTTRSRMRSLLLLGTAISTIFAVVPPSFAPAAERLSPPRVPVSRAAPSSGFAPGRLLVHFRDGVSASARSVTERPVGASEGGTIGQLGVRVLVMPPGQLDEALVSLRADP